MQAPRVAVVIPCYRVAAQVPGVIARIGPGVAAVYAVDDACPEHTGDRLARDCSDPRVRVLRHAANQGVGGAMVTGYRAALADGADIVVKLDGDGQMDPAEIERLIAPIAQGRADYTKGNRFHELEMLRDMPRVRLFGNSMLSLVSKLASGYWDVMDPTNGFTAVHRDALALLPLDKIDRGYFFESDMLFRLYTVRAVVRSAIRRGWQAVGIESGFAGLLSGQFRSLDSHDVSGLIERGGIFLRTTRCPASPSRQRPRRCMAASTSSAWASISSPAAVNR